MSIYAGKPNIGVNNISIVTPDIIWTSAYVATPTSPPTTEYSRTLNGLAWISDSIRKNPAVPSDNKISNIYAVGVDTAWACLFSTTGTSAGGIYKTNDGGMTWNKQTSAAFNNSSFPDFVYFWDKNTGVAFGDPNLGVFEIYTTLDGGTTWSKVPSPNIPAPLTGEGGGTNGYSVIGSTIWANTSAGRILKSTDKGLHWTAATVMSNQWVDKVVFRDVNNGLSKIGVTGDTLMKSTDGGTTWNRVIHSGRYLTFDLCSVPGSIPMYICTGAAIGKCGSSFSADDGATWTVIDSVPQHTAVSFLNAATGWTGGFTFGGGAGGISRWKGPTGIEEFSNISELPLYPNPNKGLFQIELKNLNGESTEIAIYDFLGKQVYHSKENNISSRPMTKDIDLSSCPKGVYLIQVRDGKMLSTNKIVVQ